MKFIARKKLRWLPNINTLARLVIDKKWLIRIWSALLEAKSEGDYSVSIPHPLLLLKKRTIRSWKVKVFTRYQYLIEIISGKVITQNQEFTTEIKVITRYQNLIIVLKGRKYWKQEPSTGAYSRIKLQHFEPYGNWKSDNLCTSMNHRIH